MKKQLKIESDLLKNFESELIWLDSQYKLFVDSDKFCHDYMLCLLKLLQDSMLYVFENKNRKLFEKWARARVANQVMLNEFFGIMDDPRQEKHGKG